MMRTLPLAALVLASLVPGFAPAAEPAPTAEQKEFFEKKVRPLLDAQCFRCHSHAAGKNKGGLVLDSRGAMLKGGDTGPALVPGDPDKSLLITAITYKLEKPQMPPKGKLPAEDIALLTEWVKMGAPWPGDTGTKTVRPRGQITDEDRRWWAFQPVRVPAIPDVKDPQWAKSPVDRFLRARLEKEGLTPAPQAERSVLIRRLTFDLLGLPPTPQEIDAFVNDKSADAYEKLVDRLLDSPHYGERWARHWLDLVRYAESDGFRIDEYRPHAWRYRDYVIRSFNTDKPYDRFVREQLAGDELDGDNPDAIAATAFLRLGMYEYNNRDARTQWTNFLNEATDLTGDAFLGLGLGCARCHDHKFDPILQSDYYRLQAFFAGMRHRDDTPLVTPKQLADYQAKLAAWEKKTEAIRKQIDALEAPYKAKAAKEAVEKFPEDIQEILLKPESQRSPYEQQLYELAYRQIDYEHAHLDKRFKPDDKEKLLVLRRELNRFESEKPAALPVMDTATDIGRMAPPTVIPKKSGASPLEPGFLTVLGDERPMIVPPSGIQTTGRRSALALWLTRPEHPLTARVAVNRVWQYHFGHGLVATTSDFGHLGEPPSHPELLDYLTDRFVREGWSFKKLHRLLVTSAAYQQASRHPAPEKALKQDPENRFLWRMPVRRLDAEQVRDAVLTVTGKLDRTTGGPSVDATTPRRTIYTKLFRNNRDPFLDVFDVPDGIVSTPQRNVTTTPTQALLLINGQYVQQQAKAFAERLQKDGYKDTDAMVEAAFRLVFGRAARADEKRLAMQFLSEQPNRIQPRAEVAINVTQGKMPFREGKAVVVQPKGTKLAVPDSPMLPEGDFTLEAFVVLHSVFEDASVRPIAAHWSGDKKKPGWTFGVTSKKSQYKPQMLVLQLMGESGENKADYDAIFSDLHLDLEKPYYVAVSVHFNEKGKSQVVFHAKDLSNDEEPLLTSNQETKIRRIPAGRGELLLGAAADAKTPRTWDGLLDDVRLSNGALKTEQLLYSADGITEKTCAYWRFELNPGMMKDSSPNGLHLRLPDSGTAGKTDARQAALVDLCHVLLNANEFLYID